MQTKHAVDTRYEEGLSMYEQGAPLDHVLAHFQALAKDAPGDARIAVSLSWLHTLQGNKTEALHWSKLAKNTAQGRFNHALALLTFGEKGVRQKLEEAIRMGGPDGVKDAIENLEEAVARKGGSYPAAEKLIAWLKEA